MASSKIIINKPSKSTNLPAPLWRKGTSSLQTILTGETISCDMFYPKIQLVDQKLIDDGVLYLQFGRISDKDYSFDSITSLPQIRENGIKWYTPYPNPYSNTSGIIGGGAVNDPLVSIRTNLIPVTNQFQTLLQAIPYWEFYKTTTCNVFDGIVSNAGSKTIFKVPYFTGCKRLKDFSSPDQYLPGAGRYKKRPQRAMTRQRNFSTSTWFCRLIVIENGRVKQVGNNSTPVIIRPNELPFNIDTVSSSSMFFGNLLPISYELREFKGEELTKYKT